MKKRQIVIDKLENNKKFHQDLNNPPKIKENKNMELLLNEFKKYEPPFYTKKVRNEETRRTIDFSEPSRDDKIKLENSLDFLDPSRLNLDFKYLK